MNAMDFSSLHEFWRGLVVENDEVEETVRFRIAGWTHRRNSSEVEDDIITFELKHPKTTDPIVFKTRRGSKILTERVRKMFEDGNPVYVTFSMLASCLMVSDRDQVLYQIPF